jgi:RNA polymerase sigma-70 factor (ECF subfamily)
MFCKQDDTYQMDAIGVEYLDGLYSYALVLSRNHADAEDLVQQTYLRATQAMGRLSEVSNTKIWFFKILRNIWVNQLRKRQSGPRIFETDMDNSFANEMAGPSKSPYDLYVSNTERKQVRAAIQELPVDFREVIVLRECEELSYHEIASIVGCPAGTVKSQLAGARTMLRMVLSVKLKEFGLSQGEKRDERVRWQ